MENQNSPPQLSPTIGPSNTDEEMVEYQPLTPGSVFAPQNQVSNQEVPPDDGVLGADILESEFIAQQKVAQKSIPSISEPLAPKSFSYGQVDGITGGNGHKFTYIVGFAVIVFIFLIGGGFLVFNKAGDSVVKSPVVNVPDQSIDLGEIVETTDNLNKLKPSGNDKKLIINGDLVSTGSISLYDSGFVGEINLDVLFGNQSYVLPDDSGEICLDVNNCNYAFSDDVVSSIGGLSGAIVIGSGLTIQGDTLISSGVTTVNGLSGALTLQGTANRVQVATSGNVVTLTTPQDIATSSSPSFQTITLAASGTQNGNVICDISNNCGYAGGSNAFIQNGNSFGATAVLGTNDSNNLVFETAGINRGQFTTDGAFVLDGVVNSGTNTKLYVPYVVGDGVTIADPLTSDPIDILTSFGSISDVTNDTVAILAESYSGIGVYAASIDGTAMQALSMNGNAVFGVTIGATSNGVYGWNAAGDGYGVYGSGQGLFGGGSSIGVGAFGGNDYGLYATSYNNTSAYFQASEETICFFGCTTYVPTQATVVIQQLNVETADLLEIQMSDNSPVFQVGYNGHTAIGNSAVIDDMTTSNATGLVNLLGGSGFSGESALIVEEVYSGDFQIVPVKNAGVFTLTVDPDVNGGGVATGLTVSAQSEATNNNNTGYITGLSSAASHFGTGMGDLLLGSISGAENRGSGIVDNAYGAMSYVGNYGLGDINNAIAHAVQITNDGSGTFVGLTEGIDIQIYQNSGIINDATGLNISYISATDTAYGLNINTVNATDGYGAAIASQPTVSLWLGNDGDYTTANAGIMFGLSLDTNLYRGAADQLKTDDTLLVQTTTDSITALTVMDADGGNSIFNVDSINERISIGGASAGGALSVVNSNVNQQALILKGAVGQSAYILDILDSSNNQTFSIENDGNVVLYALAGANNAAYLCRNGSNQIAACNTTGAGAAFVQGGNTFGATGTLGTNDANALVLETANTARVTLSFTGTLDIVGHTAIGATASPDSSTIYTLGDTTQYASSSAVLTVQETVSDITTADLTAGQVSSFLLNRSVANGGFYGSILQVRENAGDTNYLDAVVGSVDDIVLSEAHDTFLGIASSGSLVLNTTASNDLGAGIGVWGTVSNMGSGNIGTVVGVKGLAQTANSATMTTARGGEMSVIADGSSVINAAIGLEAYVQANDTSTITDAYGVSIASASGTGTIDNNYGLYVNDQSGMGSTSSYNIYSEGSGANLLQGHTAIGADGQINGGGSANVVLYVAETVDSSLADNDYGLEVDITSDPSAPGGAVLGTLSRVTSSATATENDGWLIGIQGGASHESDQDVGTLTGVWGYASVSAGSSGNVTSTAVGLTGQFDHWGTGTVAAAASLMGVTKNAGLGTVTTAMGGYLQVRNDNAGGTIGTAIGLTIDNPNNAGTLTTNVGLSVAGMTAGATNIGVNIGTAGTQTLVVGSTADGTTANAGIAFGASMDTNLYRSGVDILATDSSFEINGAGSALYIDGTVELLNSFGYLGIDTGSGYVADLGLSDSWIYSPLDISGELSLQTLGSADTSTYLCINGSDQVATCNSTGSGVAFVQGGNSFAATAILGTNDANSLSFETQNLVQATIAVGGAVTFQNTTDTTTGFKVMDADGGTSVLNVDTTNERVGIGIDAPAYKLDVATDVSTSYAANFFNDGNNQDRYGIRVQAGADDASGTTYYLDAYDGDGGQVGYIANVAGTFGLTDVSDIRTKTNVTDTEVDVMDVLAGLHVVDFNRLQNPNGSRITGFIAQEVQGVYSQAVTTGSDGYLGVMKDAFIPLLVKGHQEQQAQINSLGNQVNNVQNYYNTTVSQTQSSDFADLNVSGAATVATLTVYGSATIQELTVVGNTNLSGNLTVVGDVSIGGKVMGSSLTRGKVTIDSGLSEVEYVFDRAFDEAPNVVITPTNAFSPDYRVEATATGFRLILREPATESIIFNYQAQQ